MDDLTVVIVEAGTRVGAVGSGWGQGRGLVRCGEAPTSGGKDQ